MTKVKCAEKIKIKEIEFEKIQEFEWFQFEGHLYLKIGTKAVIFDGISPKFASFCNNEIIQPVNVEIVYERIFE